jgi:hypothetical protein
VQRICLDRMYSFLEEPTKMCTKGSGFLPVGRPLLISYPSS